MSKIDDLFAEFMARINMREEFSSKVKDAAWSRSKGICEKCGLSIKPKRPQYDHILPCALGGKPTLANCQVLCAPCHKAKSAHEIKGVRKSDRQRKAHVGIKPAPKQKISNRGFAPTEKHKPEGRVPVNGPAGIERRFGVKP